MSEISTNTMPHIHIWNLHPPCLAYACKKNISTSNFIRCVHYRYVLHELICQHPSSPCAQSKLLQTFKLDKIKRKLIGKQKQTKSRGIFKEITWNKTENENENQINRKPVHHTNISKSKFNKMYACNHLNEF